jgi:hypothetical protein
VELGWYWVAPLRYLQTVLVVEVYWNLDLDREVRGVGYLSGLAELPEIIRLGSLGQNNLRFHHENRVYEIHRS